MSKHIYLALVLHNNQPLGNFSEVYEYNFSRAYEPLISLLERYPTIQLTLHYTGSLLDWLKEHQPDFIERLKVLAQRKQIELLSGGYYEPILASIPDEDKIGQIQKLNQTLKQLFGTNPQGIWLAERVWEPGLAKPIAQAGIKYSVLDDTHFKMVGKIEAETFGYYLTEEQGYKLAIFPGPQTLRYIIPWEKVEKTVEFLREHADESGPVATIGDDGEKFGSWPGTYKLIYEQKWLENLFQAIQQNSEWLHTTRLGDYYQSHAPLGLIYLPTASYSEMLEWALPAKTGADFARLKKALQAKAGQDEAAALALNFIRGGFWRNFLVKYPEINTQHKKMYYVSQKVAAIKNQAQYEQARDLVWQGQCNETYWHGVFGGIYLPHLRTATYAALIEAEKLADASKQAGKWLEAEQFDFDYDGKPEVLINGDVQNLYFDPADGGSLFEWDFRPRNFNLLNVLTRRPEAYHQNLLETAQKQVEQAENQPEGREILLAALSNRKEAGLESLLHYDRYRRASFLDHFLTPEVTLDDFYRSEYSEISDFVRQPYEFEVKKGKKGNKLKLKLWREGQLKIGEEQKLIQVSKRFKFEAGSNQFEVKYTLTNIGSEILNTIFGFETNYGLNSGHADDSFYTINGTRPENSYLDSRGESEGVQNLSLENNWFKLGVSLEFEHPAKLWRFPIETVQNSEGGLERVYQASCLLSHWTITLNPGESWISRIKFSLNQLD